MPTQPSKDPTAMATSELETAWACSRVVHDFFHHYDHWRYGRMLDLYTPDGVWHRAGAALRGHARILEELERRPRNQRVAHVVTNLRVEPATASTASATYYLTVYRHAGEIADDAAAPMAGPAMLLAGTAGLVHTAQGWKFDSQTLTRRFEAGPAR
ncbi:nuclear transport factor 2 family protein [Pigmentiphaga sp. GD03639]|uniref:SnoaL-like domain-containing protein n=1 Tax=Pigmentiphaga daeguensis TaxID=414049 RepID=A0ABP3LF01_9BURK|nr:MULTISPECIES: nuclear transport factor 2 family protein [unclassified Pigmentiphaga]MDH2235003.1 nuclear transport factor 2 family protein [Pigmentiphaga sp. GD03639]